MPSVRLEIEDCSLYPMSILVFISPSPLGKMATTTEVLVTSDLSNAFAAEFYSPQSVWHMNPSVCF